MGTPSTFDTSRILLIYLTAGPPIQPLSQPVRVPLSLPLHVLTGYVGRLY